MAFTPTNYLYENVLNKFEPKIIKMRPKLKLIKNEEESK